MPERQLYEQLCRGEVSMSPEQASKLKCRYTTRGNPYFILSPIKEEQAARTPDIWIFHDIINDVEIATIKKMAIPRVKISCFRFIYLKFIIILLFNFNNYNILSFFFY